ncbi:MAG: efflux RND transporter periplasmic adaptor subunit [Alphaproteobacteria bacterium]|nr:efflux RND transporter periplasmic adaptor subunit [Alphaproteobacteria bacterium]HPF45298.1 efflux RND transporter periplasmic adaptor subunit [Emcibacteraceae bacterium]HRW28363.1 efflux RND transporter periplasmic adaptor subunit [Emcibacteraceae bacterium]
MKKSYTQLTIVLGIAVITSVIFVTMYIFRPKAPVERLEDRVERLEVITAKKQDVFPIVKTQAVVESKLTINIKSQVSGQIVYTSPKFLTGGFFDTGEVILKIDPSDYELALAQAEVNVARAEQTLSVEKEQAELARQDWEKYGEGKATELVLRIPQLREAEAGLKGAQANYEAQRIRLERTEVKAPFPLMIDEKQVDLGQVVGTNQDLVSVFGTEEAEIRMPLSQKQIDLLDIKNVGILPKDEVLDVKIKDLTREDHIAWDAQILRVESSIDRKSRVYYAVATIYDPMNLKHEKPTPPLLPGVFVELEVFGPKISDVFHVPVKAMHDDDDIFIFEDGKLITKPVKVVDRDKDFVTIESGIEVGDLITTSPPFSYVPGMKSMVANLDGVPVARPGGGPNVAGGQRPAAGATSGGPATANAAEAQAGDQTNNRASFANMTPEQRRAAIANMTPEQRAAMQARRQAAGGGNGSMAGGNSPQGGNQ